MICRLTLSKTDMNFPPNKYYRGEWHKTELLVFNDRENYAMCL